MRGPGVGGIAPETKEDVSLDCAGVGIPTAIGLGGSFSGGSFIGTPRAAGAGGMLGLSVEGSLTGLKCWGVAEGIESIQ